MLPPASSAARMPFIVSSDLDTVDPATRKLIRSHVMRGKKGKKSKGRVCQGQAKINAAPKIKVEVQDVVDMYKTIQPGRVGTRLYFVDFPPEIEPSMLLKMAEVSTAAMQIIFPLLMGIGYHPDGRGWLYPSARDVATLHINAFAIQSFIDRVLNHQPLEFVNSAATMHYQKGLQIISKRLAGDDVEAKISDGTILAVLKLATAAMFDGDTKLSKGHMQGLLKMIDMRGGLDAFANNPKLLVELWRSDLGIALLADADPMLYCHPGERLPNFPELSSFGPRIRCPEDLPFVQDLNPELAQIWRVVRNFCLLANLGTQTHMLIQPATIYETMTAVMYRLLRMRFTAGSLDESIRLGLLSFTHHVFLQWKDIVPPRHGFARQYRDYLVLLQSEEPISPHIMLWMLMTAAISILYVSTEPWLEDRLRIHLVRCGINSWSDLHAALKSIMWISLLDEERGKRTYAWLKSKGEI